MTIIVPWDVARTSPNLRLHKMQLMERRQHARGAAILAWRESDRPVLAGPVSVLLTIRRARPLDWDNAVAGAKPVLDGLMDRKRQGEGVTEDDGPMTLTSIAVRWEIDPRYKRREEVLVTFIPEDG